MKPVYIGACSYCDFRQESATPVECNLAVIRHKCERKYPGLDPLAKGYVDELRARGIPTSDAERDLAVEHERPAA